MLNLKKQRASRLYLIAMFLVAVNCTGVNLFAQPVHFTVQGTSKLKADSVALQLLVRGKTIPYQTVVITKGFFKISGEFPEPTLCILETGGISKALFIGNDNILVSIDENKKVVVKGSVLTEENDGYSQSIYRDKLNYIKSSNELTKNVPGESNTLVDSLSNTKNNALADIFILTRHFITSNPNSFVSLYLLNYYSKAYALKEVKEMYEGFGDKFAGTPTDSSMKAAIKLYEDMSAGQPAPAFTLLNSANDTLSLETFSGKYLLLDCWASWCQPCIRNIPELKRLKTKAPADKLAILCVSFDNSKTNWEKAIRQYGLEKFINSRAEDGFKNEISYKYDIQIIPSSFLISPDGKIVGRNLSTDEILSIIK